MSFQDALNSATPAHRDIQICLNGDLRTQWDAFTTQISELEREKSELEFQLKEESEKPAADARLGVKSPTKARISTVAATIEQVEGKMKALKPEIVKASITLRFVALPFLKWNELVIANPPREGDPNDRMWGYNTLTFYPAAMRLTGHALDGEEVSTITDKQWESLEEVLTDRMMDDVAGAINLLNRQDGASIPFSLADYETAAD